VDLCLICSLLQLHTVLLGFGHHDTSTLHVAVHCAGLREVCNELETTVAYHLYQQAAMCLNDASMGALPLKCLI
jgi:hypothetical protein